MSEKEKSQGETTEKIVTKYDKKVQRRKELELQEKKRAKRNKIIGIAVLVAIVAVLVSIPVRKYIATHETYITVGGHDITKVEFDYYYNLAANDYISTYGTYLSYMGLDTSGDFASQAYSENMSWKDYFEQLAVDTLQQNKGLINAASEAGFTYDASGDYEDFAELIRQAAEAADTSVGRYCTATFGQYATLSAIRPYVEEGYIAEAYYQSIAEERAATEDEIAAYYAENTSDYDSVDYILTEITAEIPEAQTVSDGDGGNTTIEPTEAEIQAAMDAAKEQADAALEVLEAEGTEYTGALKSSISTKYNPWLYEAERQTGDTTIIEDTDNHKYYVLMFKDRYLAETATANVRVILSSTVSGEDIIAEWTAAGSTEEAFIELVEKYSEDTYTNGNGGLYEELMGSSIDSSLSGWIFDEARKQGDITSVSEEGATYVMYYVGHGRSEWQVRIASTLLSETMNEYLTEIKEACEVLDPKGRLVYLKVQEAAANQATATDESGTDETETTPADETEDAADETVEGTDSTEAE